MILKCSGCDVEFERKKRINKGNNYCSHKCFSDFNKGQRRNVQEDLTGQIFNKLTVLGLGGRGKTSGGKFYNLWKVVCECGKEKEMTSNNLKKSKSCGCSRMLPTHNHSYQKDRLLAVSKVIFKSYIKGALKRGVEFSLTFSQFKDLIIDVCYYCGEVVPLKTRYSYDEVEVIGVDRKDNDIGYTVENSVPCCSICNYMKRKFSEEVFINQAIKINKKHANKK